MTSEMIQNPIDRAKQILQKDDQQGLTEFIDSLSSHELIHLIGHLGKNDQTRLMTMLSPSDAADVMEEIPDFQAADIVEDMEAGDAAAILDQMESDEQVDLIQEIDINDAQAILDLMNPIEAADVRRLIGYDPDTAGGIMVTEFMTFQNTQRVSDVVARLRANAEALVGPNRKPLYVVSKTNHLMGFLEVRQLLLAQPEVLLTDIMVSELQTVPLNATLQELINFFDTYDFYSVPVVDQAGRISGVVLRKDVLEAEAERQTYEHLETQGIVGGDELRTMPVLLRSRRRLSWLSVNILLNIAAASVIAYHQDVLTSVIALAVFLPIISDMSGCSGNQAIAVSMRELSIGVIKPNEVLRVWGQEASVGIINGLILGLLIAAAAFVWKGNIYLGVVAGGALALNTLVAVSIGGTVPLLLKKFGADPALASGPILTTITDMFGFFLTLTFASLLLSQLSGI